MIFLQGFIKLDQGIYEKCVGQPFDGRKKERKKERRIIITRFDCVWMQVSSLPTNSSLQNTPRYQFSLKSETINNLPILLAAILETVAS
jgi:hypothetical protein